MYVNIEAARASYIEPWIINTDMIGGVSQGILSINSHDYVYASRVLPYKASSLALHTGV